MTTQNGSEGADDEANAALDNVIRRILADGAIPTAMALGLMRDIGFDLQAIPSRERKMTVTRLKNRADLLRTHPITLTQARMIDALIEGWEAFGEKRNTL